MIRASISIMLLAASIASAQTTNRVVVGSQKASTIGVVNGVVVTPNSVASAAVRATDSGPAIFGQAIRTGSNGMLSATLYGAKRVLLTETNVLKLDTNAAATNVVSYTTTLGTGAVVSARVNVMAEYPAEAVNVWFATNGVFVGQGSGKSYSYAWYDDGVDLSWEWRVLYPSVGATFLGRVPSNTVLQVWVQTGAQLTGRTEWEVTSGGFPVWSEYITNTCKLAVMEAQ